MFRRNMILMFLGLLILISVLNILNIWIIQHNTRSDKKIRSDSSNNTLKKNKQHLNSYGFKNELLHAQLIQEEIKKSIYSLSLRYFERNSQYKYVLENIINELNMNQNLNSSIINKLSNWPTSRQLIPSRTPELGAVIEFLRSTKIRHVDNAKLGTQLKLMITFENGLKAVFKPQWYKRTTKITGLVYYGKDRHNAEVVAFYLALLLSFRRVPLALIRKCMIIIQLSHTHARGLFCHNLSRSALIYYNISLYYKKVSPPLVQEFGTPITPTHALPLNRYALITAP